MASISETKSATMRDGRRIGYFEYGDPNGAPVINCHGGLVCGTDVAAAGATAERLGVRLISPDRPGVGGSDRCAGRGLLDWPADVEALADGLGLDSFAVLGWSMGGPYAAALAYALPARVSRAATVAATPPLDDPAAFAALNRMDRRLTRLSQRAAPVAAAVFRAIGLSARHAPKRFAKLTGRDLGADDATAITAADEGADYAASVAAAMGNPRGMVDEYLVFGAAWGFDGASIARPVRIWHGDDDKLCTPELVAMLAKQIPSAELTSVAGAGHFLLHSHAPEVLEWLRLVH